MFIKICAVSVFISLITFGMSAMTEKQLQNAAKLYRNNCQPKTKTTDELIDNMHVGTWDEEKTAKCYMHCILSMMKLVDKSGHFDMALALPQMTKLPSARVAPTEKTLEECKTAGVDSSDKCDGAWQFAKCIYFANAENYFLP